LINKVKLSEISNDLTEDGAERWKKIKTPPFYNDAPTHSDSPAIVDRLGREAFAEFLVNIIYQLQNEQPSQEEQQSDSILMHIDGPWGSGKSTLLNLMKDKFEQKKWMVVQFNAWQNQSIDHPWWQLMDAVYKGAKEKSIPPLRKKNEISFWKFFYIFTREHLWRLSVNRRSLYSLLLAVALIGAGAFLIFWSLSQSGGNNISHIQADVSPTSTLSHIKAEIITNQTNGSNDTVSRIISSLGGTGAGIITIIGGFLSIIGTVINTVGSESSNKRFRQSTSDPMDKIKDHFKKLTHRIVRAKSKAKSAVVILIDDLDRCRDTHVVAFLQDIQTLFRSAELSCIIAADRRWIYRSYEKAYSNFASAITEPGYPFGKLFLDKIFQFSVSLPTISDDVEKRYWKYLLNEDDKENKVNNIDDEMNKINDIPEMIKVINENKDNPLYREAAVKRLSSEEVVKPTQSLLEQFYPLLGSNPRSMKKFMNEYRIATAINLLSGCNIKNDRTSLLKFALWVLVNFRWPDLAEYLKEYPKMVNYIGESEKTLDILEIPKDIYKLFQDQNIRNIVRGNTLQGISLDENSIREILCIDNKH
jgi:hypothetical protein